MVLAAFAPRRAAVEAAFDMPSFPAVAAFPDHQQASKEVSRENEIAVTAGTAPANASSPAPPLRSFTPRQLRESRRRTIHSCVEVIESSMTSEDWARLKRLSKQGAVHYQAEEEFMFAPVIRRSLSAPNSSLAERYERLRSCTSPNTFRRPCSALTSAIAATPADAMSSPSPDASVFSPGTSVCSPTSALSPAANPNGPSFSMSEQAGTAATVPRRATRDPTRIIVRSVNDPMLSSAVSQELQKHQQLQQQHQQQDQQDQQDQQQPQSQAQQLFDDQAMASGAPSPPPNHLTDASLTDDSRASMDCLECSVGLAPRAKRGSDPQVEADEKDGKKKKKGRGLFHRRRRYTSTSESTEESTSPMRDRSWTQRVQHYMSSLLRRR